MFGWLSLYCLHSLYILSSLLFLCFCSSILYDSILFYSRMGGCLWNVSVCFSSVCVGCLGGCLFIAYIHYISSLLLCRYLLFSSIVYYSILFYSSMGGCLWNVSVCFLWVCADCLGGCLFIAYIHYISSLLFCSFAFLLYSLRFYSILFQYGRLLVECVGVFFIGVCRLLGRLLPVACGMYRYVFCCRLLWIVSPTQ